MFGNYEKYLRNKADYIEFDKNMEKKLKYTTLMNIFKKSKRVIDRDELKEMFNMGEGDEFDHFITEFLTKGSLKFLNTNFIQRSISCHFI